MMPEMPVKRPTIRMCTTSVCSAVECFTSPFSMAPFSMLGTSVWRIRLTKERTMATRKVRRCDAMTGSIRRHHGRLWSRRMRTRGPSYFDRTPPSGLAESLFPPGVPVGENEMAICEF
jgi:hypothetical protein